ncbi:hypothetical protein [Ferrimonas sp. YFM]|uniref:hypothetical protein n=1 Tax=Ferrimonas sp. YFM TaxID=3028878 RepID=UPI002573F77A|nr:hypothetical protein [Ferrimonas sp. YFM]BDY04674.1 hypothetical protein F0521_17150 [Ferrimonas sp. YFM]
MKKVLRLIIAVMFVLFAAYKLNFFILPSVTVINGSEVIIKQATVTLPSSNLNFGLIDGAMENTIHYSLEQSDGVYRYQFDLLNDERIAGECGYVTSNEVHKRVRIELHADHRVRCTR